MSTEGANRIEETSSAKLSGTKDRVEIEKTASCLNMARATLFDAASSYRLKICCVTFHMCQPGVCEWPHPPQAALFSLSPSSPSSRYSE